MPIEPHVRRAGVAESDALADLFVRVRQQNLGNIPPLLHDRDDVRGWMRDVVFGHSDVWVVGEPGQVVGFMVLTEPDWLSHLYVDASATGRGLGSSLLDRALTELDGNVQLWTFQSNTGACRFYERHGFVAVERTDGDNEEGAPDVRYVRRVGPGEP